MLKIPQHIKDRFLTTGAQIPLKWQDVIHKLLVVDSISIATYRASTRRKSIQSGEKCHLSVVDPGVGSEQLWKRISNPAIMPKHQSFMWLLNSKGIWCGADLALWTNTNVSCIRCQQPADTLEHSFWSCPVVTTFWNSFLALLSITPSLYFNWKSIATLIYCPKPTKASITNYLTVISALWAIHRTRLAGIYSEQPTDDRTILAVWTSTLQDIIRAKYRTAIVHSSLNSFRQKWQWLITRMNINFNDPTIG